MTREADPWILLSMLWLSFFGLLMIASSSMGLAIGDSSYLLKIVIKQTVFLFGGYFAMSFMSRRFSVDWLRTPSLPTYAVVMVGVLLICLAFPAVGGAKAWIRLPLGSMDISIQPSEFAKIMSILVVAAYLGDSKKHYRKNIDTVKRPLLFVVIYIIVVWLFQSDFGTAVVIGIITSVCILVPGHIQLKKIQRYLAALILFGVAAVIFILSPYGESLIKSLPLQDYQKNRFISSINPFADRYDTGYQLINGLIAFASGGWTGLGFGNSVRKYTNFPAANTDFILSIVVEELGIVGFLMIFIPYMIIIFRLFKFAMDMKCERGRVILVGTATYLMIHSLFNIGGATGLIPLTGVPLLMISSGGSSTLAFMMLIGIAEAVIAQYKRGEID